MEKSNFTNEQMANYIKGDRNRLTTSVRNLLTAMRDILEPKEYLELVELPSRERNFWSMTKMRIFYDMCMSLFEQKRKELCN